MGRIKNKVSRIKPFQSPSLGMISIIGLPRCGQATGPAIKRDSDERKLRKLERYWVVIDGDRYADHATAKQ
jgi:hypothetical protein